MICEECRNRKATVHMQKIVKGKKEEIHLCEECARERDALNFENPLSIHSFLTGLLDINPKHQFQSHSTYSYQCSHCGFTYDKIRQVGRLGCSHCYEEFQDKLGPLIRKIQGNLQHTGKVPKRTGESIALRRQLNNLKNELNEAIYKQEFENAAVLRDQIRDLENNIEGI